MIRNRGIKGYGGIFVANNAAPTFTGNIDTNALGAGIAMQSCTATFTNNVSAHPATQGIWIQSGNSGSAAFNYNDLLNLNSGQTALQNDSPTTFTTTLNGNIGF